MTELSAAGSIWQSNGKLGPMAAKLATIAIWVVFEQNAEYAHRSSSFIILINCRVGVLPEAVFDQGKTYRNLIQPSG